MTIQWQYTDSTNTTVSYTDENGTIYSCQASNPDIVAWISAGNTPTAYTPSISEQKGAIITQLQELDAYLPRGVEDMIIAYSMDTSKLPTVQQTRLSQKQSLRSQLAALGN